MCGLVTGYKFGILLARLTVGKTLANCIAEVSAETYRWNDRPRIHAYSVETALISSLQAEISVLPV